MWWTLAKLPKLHQFCGAVLRVADKRPALKNCLFPITRIAKKLVTLAASKTFFYLTQTKYFYFKCYLHQNCYLHHNCSINRSWNITQLYSSAKPLQNVPSSVFQFVNLCFLPLLCSFSIQNWKKIWFCYICKWVGRKEMLAKMSKYLCWNLFIRATTQIRAVYKDHKILVTLKSYITLPFKFLDLQHKICIFLWLSYLWKHFSFI